MTRDMNPAQLSSTSAFVSLLAGDAIHTSIYSTRYRGMLDLSSGMHLLNECSVFSPYLAELVKNRKWIILDEVLRGIQQGARQVVILGSGLDTLSLEIAWRKRDVTIYEIDVAQMELKEELIRRTAPRVANRIRCVTADLSQIKEMIQKIKEAGWTESESSVVVLEGISYYLKPKQMWENIRCLDKCRKNKNVLEYMTPAECIRPDRADIPDRVFDIIQKSISESIQIERFSYETVARQARAAGYDVISHNTMHDIEKKRTGISRYYPTVSSGWVEIVVLLQSITKVK